MSVPGRTPIYMDNHATTPLDERVLEAMLPYLGGKFGNAASHTHAFGWEAEAAVRKSREQLAALFNARPADIVFTSGATESDNLAIRGTAYANRSKGAHIITCLTEHKAVLDCVRHLESDGFEVTYLSVDRHGSIDLQELRTSIRRDTILVSLMAANNEIGTFHPLEEIGRTTRELGVLFHTDAAQAVGKIPIDIESMKIDLLSVSAHKMYGPKGVGALYVRRRPQVQIEPLIHGGGHERGLRSGTLNVPGCVGLGKAAELAGATMVAESDRMSRLRDRLHTHLSSRLDGVTLNGHPTERLAGNLNLSFEGVEAEAVMMNAREVAVSSGSACTSATPEPSHVLQAIGVPSELGHGSIRFGLGRFNTEEEVDGVADQIVEAVVRVRGMVTDEFRDAAGGA